MKNYSLPIKKLLAIPFLVTALFFTLGTPKTEAVVSVPTWDGLSIWETIVQQGLDILEELSLEKLMDSWDVLAYTAAQELLNIVTDNTIAWIRGGFNGSPSFDVDPEQLLLGLADSVAGNTANEIRLLADGSFLSGFVSDLANELELSTRSYASAKFAEQIKSPFPSNINPEDFYSSGVNSFEENGGWGAMESALSDAGNPFGMRIITSKELAIRQNEARSVQEKKLERSSGFLDIIDESKCEYPESVQMIMAQNDGMDPASDEAYKRQYCPVSSPGKIAGDQLTQALGIDMERLGFVDNINKIWGALIRQLTTEAVKELF